MIIPRDQIWSEMCVVDYIPAEFFASCQESRYAARASRRDCCRSQIRQSEGLDSRMVKTVGEGCGQLEEGLDSRRVETVGGLRQSDGLDSRRVWKEPRGRARLTPRLLLPGGHTSTSGNL